MSRPARGRRRLELASSSSGRSSRGADAIDELAGLTSSQPAVSLSQPPSPVERRRGRVGRESACITQPIAVDIQSAPNAARRSSHAPMTGYGGSDTRSGRTLHLQSTKTDEMRDESFCTRQTTSRAR